MKTMQTKKGNYDFVCLECEYTVTVEATNLDDATTEAFLKHDAHHAPSGSNCGAAHYRITPPNGIPLEF